MKKLIVGLGSKILVGGFVFLIPLAIALIFLYQAGTAQINAAELERDGLNATRPLFDALFDWQAAGLSRNADAVATDLDKYRTTMKKYADALAYNAGAMAAVKIQWSGPDALLAAAKAGASGSIDQFASLHKKLITDLRYLADTSTLVLDPDLDSYYLMLALYQSIPSMLNDVTELRRFRSTTGAMPATSALPMYALARSLQTTAAELKAQVARSVNAVDQGYGPVPGYDTAAAQTDSIIQATETTSQAAFYAAQSNEPFDAGAFENIVGHLMPRLRQMYSDGMQAFNIMLDLRVAHFQGILTVAFASALAGLALGMVLLLWVSRGILGRVSGIVRSLEALARGDLVSDVSVKLKRSKDELGSLARTVERLRGQLQDQVASIAQVVDQLSLMGSNLASNAEQSAAAIAEMSAASGHVAKFAAGQKEETDAAGGETRSMGTRIAESNRMTQGIATRLRSFQQSMEANLKRIQATAAEAQRTGELAESLSRAGEDGERSMDDLRQSVDGMAGRTREIQDIVQIILDIAGQTNLLSMNAAIEAAHAGDSGKGFAVVAEEIRKLAETSSSQAQSVKTLIESIASSASQTMTQSETTSESFRTVRRDIVSVVGASQAIAEQMSQQEIEDHQLLGVLEELARFYGELSQLMEAQVIQSQTVGDILGRLEDASRQISDSMQEQKIGMEHTANAVIQVRDTSAQVAGVMETLTSLMTRFKTVS
jgi:methyl-accepting chemotaxis protein